MFITNIKLSVTSLYAHKTRSILTILGISIGIAIVIAIMAAGKGLDKMIQGQLETFSPATISIEVRIPTSKKSAGAAAQFTGAAVTTMKNKDVEAVAKYPNVVAAYGYITGQAIVSYQGQTKTSLILGEGYNMPEVEKFSVSEGRMFTKEEDDSLSQVVVLGATVKENLFGDDTAAGKTVYIKGKPFKVVGVAAKRGAAFFMDMDNLVIVPVKTMQKRIMGIDYVMAIIAKMKDMNQADATVADLTALLRERHDITDPNKDDFEVQTMSEAMDMLATIVNGITFLLVALVCISLVVGGVGIMNIMYVSVTERVFEIGLRKAVGAKAHDILMQFLFEAVIITVLGGLVGIVLGALLALIIYLIAISYNFVWVYAIPVSSILLSVGFSAFVGLLFGIYPAKKAAGLDPITALRQE
jgi:ABC-type antimicrobial peptide transport system permease subunit